MRSTTTIAIAALLALVAANLGAQTRTAPELTKRNFDRWLEFIRPNEEELRWERIGWRNAFWPAVEEARRLGRPILLWTMNGHPLGCT